jgi:hypothetical protein
VVPIDAGGLLAPSRASSPYDRPGLGQEAVQCILVYTSAVHTSAVQCSAAVQCSSAVQCIPVHSRAVQCSAVHTSAVQSSAVQCGTSQKLCGTQVSFKHLTKQDDCIISLYHFRQSRPTPNISDRLCFLILNVITLFQVPRRGWNLPQVLSHH